MSRFIETGDEQRAKGRADTEQKYQDWMADVDAHILATAQVRASDLADQPYRSLFDDGMEPIEAAEYVLEEEGFEL